MQVLTVQIEACGQFSGCLQLRRLQTAAVKLARITLKHTFFFLVFVLSAHVNRTFQLAPYGRMLGHKSAALLQQEKTRRRGKSKMSSEAYRCSAPLKNKTKEGRRTERIAQRAKT